MQTSHTTFALLTAAALLSSGCTKKSDDAASSSTSATKPTGIKGTVKGKPFAGKVAWLVMNSSVQADLHIKSFDAKCTLGDIIREEADSIQVEVISPAVTTGVTRFGAKTFANLIMKQGTGMSSTDTSNGEIEWITIPTATTKGLARIRVLRDPDTKVEGTMEVGLCKPT